MVRQRGRGELWGEVFARTLLVSTAGGVLLGLTVWCVVVIAWRQFLWLAFVSVAWAVGGAFGVILGLVAGPVVATVASIALVPYPGPRRCLLTVRSSALVAVAVVPLVLAWAIADGTDWVEPQLLVVVIPSLVGAWFMSPFVIRWYIREMESETGQRSRLLAPPTMPW